MKYILNVLREQIQYIPLIFKMAKYDTKSKYQMHYLGILWQFIMPIIQVGIYWFIFGIGIRSGAPVGDVPFLVWLIAGLIPWFFIGPTITQASNSVYSKINLVSKMKFPVSILPTITIVSNTFNFFIMLAVAQIIMVINGVYPTIQTIQLIYYIFSSFALVYALSLLFSTLSTIARDFQNMLQSVIRLLFFVTPILWDPSQMPEIYHNLLKLNPFYYLIMGFRSSYLSEGWFFNNLAYGLYFWSFVLLTLLIGSFMHIRFRSKFIDYI